MDYEPCDPIIAFILELKLDVNMFEWQKQPKFSCCTTLSRASWVYHLCAQASESVRKVFEEWNNICPASFTTSTSASSNSCLMQDNHPLYACSNSKHKTHEKMISILKTNVLFETWPLVMQYNSLCQCRKCQGPHHTLHVESKETAPSNIVISFASNSTDYVPCPQCTWLHWTCLCEVWVHSLTHILHLPVCVLVKAVHLNLVSDQSCYVNSTYAKHWSATEMVSWVRHAVLPNGVGDVVVLQEDVLVSTKWLLARITQVHMGNDGHVHVNVASHHFNITIAIMYHLQYTPTIYL